MSIAERERDVAAFDSSAKTGSTAPSCAHRCYGRDEFLLYYQPKVALSQEVPGSELARKLAKGIIALAHALKMNVVAEGVQTKQQANFL